MPDRGAWLWWLCGVVILWHLSCGLPGCGQGVRRIQCMSERQGNVFFEAANRPPMGWPFRRLTAVSSSRLSDKLPMVQDLALPSRRPSWSSSFRPMTTHMGEWAKVSRYRDLERGMSFQAPGWISSEVLSVLAPPPPSIAHVRNDTQNSQKISRNIPKCRVKTLDYP